MHGGRTAGGELKALGECRLKNRTFRTNMIMVVEGAGGVAPTAPPQSLCEPKSAHFRTPGCSLRAFFLITEHACSAYSEDKPQWETQPAANAIQRAGGLMSPLPHHATWLTQAGSALAPRTPE